MYIDVPFSLSLSLFLSFFISLYLILFLSQDIKPMMRRKFRQTQQTKDLEALVTATTDAYTSRVEAERKKKDAIIALYKKKEKELEDAFFWFPRQYRERAGGLSTLYPWGDRGS